MEIPNIPIAYLDASTHNINYFVNIAIYNIPYILPISQAVELLPLPPPY
jgi:hypothetical protein